MDELDALSRDDEEFFYKTVPLTRQGKDGMIEIPLPFKEEDPVFTCNRSTARNRTITTLNSLKRKKPDNVAKQSRQIRKESQLRHSTFHPSASSSAWKPTRTGLLDPRVLGVAERKGEDSIRC